MSAEPDAFRRLPEKEKTRIRLAGNQLGRFAFDRCAAVIIATKAGLEGELVNSGSGFVVRQGDAYALVTAWHVIRKWRELSDAGVRPLLQAGQIRLNPKGDDVLGSEVKDIGFVRITAGQASAIGRVICDLTPGLTPGQPAIGSFMVLAGYPGLRRQRIARDEFEFNCFTGVQSVTTVGESYVMCLFERAEWISTQGPGVPERGFDFGGMSGGPAFLIQELAYPLVGVISEFSPEFEILRVALLSSVHDLMSECGLS